MLTVYVSSSDVWDFFQENKKRLEEFEDIIAETDDGLSVCLTNHLDTPLIRVEGEDNSTIRQESALSKDKCKEIVEEFYGIIESFSIQNDDDPDPEAGYRDEDFEELAERELDLVEVTKDFITFAMGYFDEDYPIEDGVALEILDEIEKICSEKGFPFYRPYIEEDENGNARVVGL